MRSTWLGFGLGLFTLIGCNALWQGYLSPIDDPADGAIADLSDVDLTGEPPPDQTGQPPSDMAMPKLCGFSSTPTGSFRYGNYATIFNLPNGYNPQKLAVIDLDGDGLTEVAVNDGTAAIKIMRASKDSAGSCSFSAQNDCNVTNPTYDLKALNINGTRGVFIASRNNNNNTAFSTCSNIPPTEKSFPNTESSTAANLRDVTVPRLNATTNGIFILHEKTNSSDTNGDRVLSIKLDNALTMNPLTVLRLGNNGNFEPRYASAARIDGMNDDGMIDFVSLEVNGTTHRLRAYTNNHMTTPAPNIASGTLATGFADSYDITSARLSNDSYDDPVAISRTLDHIIPFIISSPPAIAIRLPITIPATARNRDRLIFLDIDNNNIDELITINGSNISIYNYNTVTNVLTVIQTLTPTAGLTPVSIAVGYLEKEFSSGPPDIFIASQNTSKNTAEIGVFRHVPMNVNP